MQKIRLEFLFHLAEEFDWQKGACTMPYVTGSWISVERGEGREKRKAREIKGFACRGGGGSVVSRESPVCDEISRVRRGLRQKVMAFTLGTRD